MVRLIHGLSPTF
uniref:Uncharacterized protein n=1 Tax=Arundo donax TaxID=35708 RepID=A0A0A8YTN2_ARUDO